jgi:hypothetical protein
MKASSFFADDRAVSIAVTHVLTIGITTILITGLLVGGSGLLEDEKSDATRNELRTIGNRMAAELSSSYYSAENGGAGGRMVVRVTHPSQVAGNSYNVELRQASGCSGIPGNPSGGCMVMQPPKGQNEVKIPLDPDIEIKSSSTTVQGGTVYIVVEDTDPDPDVTEYKVTIRSSPPKLAPMPEVTR